MTTRVQCLETQGLRARALAEESLVDVSQWARSSCLVHPILIDVAMTDSLWKIAERIPFRLLSEVTLRDRVLNTLARASRELRDLQAQYGLAATPETLARSYATRFAVYLPSDAADSDYQWVCLIYSPGDAFEPVITLALADEMWTNEVTRASLRRNELDLPGLQSWSRPGTR